MFKVGLFFLVILISSELSAKELVKGATVLEVASSNSNRDVFWVRHAGGAGPCANTAIDFPANKSQSKESYNQSFAIALAAVTSGKKIRIHNYEDNSCRGANYISIYAN